MKELHKKCYKILWILRKWRNVRNIMTLKVKIYDELRVNLRLIYGI